MLLNLLNTWQQLFPHMALRAVREFFEPQDDDGCSAFVGQSLWRPDPIPPVEARLQGSPGDVVKGILSSCRIDEQWVLCRYAHERFWWGHGRRRWGGSGRGSLFEREVVRLVARVVASVAREQEV
ncbi:hypothetical protein M0222_04040 [Myxococcus fulvus]|nr:hypothetical protein [Myxococcus fulvus]